MNRPLQEFLLYLKYQLNYSDNTIDAYRRDVEKFNDFLMENDILMDQVSKETLQDFLAKELKNGISKNSCARRVASLKNFYQYLKKQDYIKEYPFQDLERIKKDHHLPDVLDKQQIKTLFELNSMRKDELALRDSVVLKLLFFTGIRVSELCNIRLNEINLQNRTILVHGKGNKERIVAFTNDCGRLLDNYIKNLRRELMMKSGDIHDYLIVNVWGHPITPRGIEYILKAVEKKTNFPIHLHPHLLRHSFATTLINNGAQLHTVQKLLGHESINTTSIYTHVSLERQMKVYAKFNPIDFKKK